MFSFDTAFANFVSDTAYIIRWWSVRIISNIVEFLKEYFEFLRFKIVHLPFERSLSSIKLVLFILFWTFSKLFLLIQYCNHQKLYILYETLCVIQYHLYNFTNAKDTLGEVLLLTFNTLPWWDFSRFLNFTNGTKSDKASQIFRRISFLIYHLGFVVNVRKTIIISFQENLSQIPKLENYSQNTLAICIKLISFMVVLHKKLTD